MGDESVKLNGLERPWGARAVLRRRVSCLLYKRREKEAAPYTGANLPFKCTRSAH